jgi:Regulator of G protein signaling domain
MDSSPRSRQPKRKKKAKKGGFACFGGGAVQASDDDSSDDDGLDDSVGNGRSPTLESLERWREDAREIGAGEVSIKSQYPLVKILNHPEARRYLKLYASKEFSVENMLCWEALTDYLNESDPKKRCEIFITIVDTFFAEGSPQHVTLSFDEQMLAEKKTLLEDGEDIEDVLEECDQIVDEGKLQLELTNLHDIYVRFGKSPDFSEMIKVTNLTQQNGDVGE